MTRGGIILAVLAIVAVGGCQNEAANYQSVRMPTTDYDRAFEVTQQVLAEQFTLEKADKGSGRITTGSQAVQGVLTGGMLTPTGPVQGLRRVATAQVTRANGTVMVSVKVQLQTAEAVQSAPRPTYSEYDATAAGSEGGRYVRPEERSGVVWQQGGSDAEMERKLLTEIERRLKAAGVEAETSKEEPKQSE